MACGSPIVQKTCLPSSWTMTSSPELRSCNCTGFALAPSVPLDQT